MREVRYRKKVGEKVERERAGGSRVADAIRFLVGSRDLQLECARVLHETLFVFVFTYGS